MPEACQPAPGTPAATIGGMGIGLTLALVAIFVIVLWAATTALGFEMALVSSLAISLGLTLLLNLVLGAFRKRRRG
jgi:hypothetical protein